MNDIQILLVDDHVALRTQVRRLIASQPDMLVVAEAGSVREALRLVREKALTVVAMELSLPDGDGITATAEILRQNPDLRVLGLSRHEDLGHVQRMLAAGACGYVLKRNVADHLLSAIRTVATGGTYRDPVVSSNQRELPHQADASVRNVKPPPIATAQALSAEDVAVLQRVAWGLSNKEIAEQLDKAVTDVSTHKAQVMQKLDLRTRGDVFRYAEAQGWLRKEADDGS